MNNTPLGLYVTVSCREITKPLFLGQCRETDDGWAIALPQNLAGRIEAERYLRLNLFHLKQNQGLEGYHVDDIEGIIRIQSGTPAAALFAPFLSKQATPAYSAVEAGR